MQLRQQIQSLKKGALPITEYLDKMKSLVDALAAISHPISERDLITFIFSGIGQECAPVITSVDNRKAPITYDELFGQLLTNEMRLESYSPLPNIEQPTTPHLLLLNMGLPPLCQILE